MDVNIDSSSRVFFFIKNIEDAFGEVLVPDMAGISIDKNNRPVVLRSKSSFFRTYKGKGRNTSLKKRLRESMKKRNEPINNAKGTTISKTNLIVRLKHTDSTSDFLQRDYFGTD